MPCLICRLFSLLMRYISNRKPTCVTLMASDMWVYLSEFCTNICGHGNVPMRRCMYAQNIHFTFNLESNAISHKFELRLPFSFRLGFAICRILFLPSLGYSIMDITSSVYVFSIFFFVIW